MTLSSDLQRERERQRKRQREREHTCIEDYRVPTYHKKGKKEETYHSDHERNAHPKLVITVLQNKSHLSNDKCYLAKRTIIHTVCGAQKIESAQKNHASKC